MENESGILEVGKPTRNISFVFALFGESNQP